MGSVSSKEILDDDERRRDLVAVIDGRSKKSHALAYESRMGDTYYLHEGKTKTGKPRYFFAKAIGVGAIAAMPEGFEVSESINGVVSVRRTRPDEVRPPDADIAIVEAALKRERHLVGYVVRAVDGAIVIFEPHPRPTDLAHIASMLGAGHRSAAFFEEPTAHAKYVPVMKFEPDESGYAAFRMTYRGKGGWSWALASGRLESLAKKLVRSIGTDAFYELM